MIDGIDMGRWDMLEQSIEKSMGLVWIIRDYVVPKRKYRTRKQRAGSFLSMSIQIWVATVGCSEHWASNGTQQISVVQTA